MMLIIFDILNTISGYFLLMLFAAVLILGILGALAKLWDGAAALYEKYT